MKPASCFAGKNEVKYVKYSLNLKRLSFSMNYFRYLCHEHVSNHINVDNVPTRDDRHAISVFQYISVFDFIWPLFV